jgi:phosphoglycerate dehydrogenase-like enzyme
MTVAVINSFARPFLESRLPASIEPRWFTSDDLSALVPEAEIGWFDAFGGDDLREVVGSAVKLKWLNTLAAGVDPFPLDLMRERGVVLTNGAGLNAITIAEYAVMGMLTVAKGWREVVRAQERREWLTEAPGKRELYGSSALILGAGAIGGRIGELLRPFGVAVTEVRRRPAAGMLGADEWRARLGEFDWVIVAIPSTSDTARTIGAAELAAMRHDAIVMNFARGALIDTDALVEALNVGRIGGAFLDVTDPEPLPPEHPLWAFDNVHISMHLSGRSQDKLVARAAERFLDNLARWERGEALTNAVDLTLGY